MITVKAKKGRYCPSIICDVCGDEIINAQNALVKFGNDLFPDRLLFCHKGNCDIISDNGQYRFFHVLSVFLVWLVQNADFDWEKAKDNADWLSRIQ